MTGDAVKATDRHGRDGRLRSDGLLDCQLLEHADLGHLSNPHQFNATRDAIRQAIKGIDTNKSVAFSTWTQSPWNPFMLEWQVEFYPNPRGDIYDSTYVTENYTLAEKEVNLSCSPGRENHFVTGQHAGDTIYEYRGFSILTPHAGIQLEKKIQAYVAVQYCEAQEPPLLPPSDTGDYFRKHHDAIKAWAASGNKVEPPVPMALQAYDRLQSLPCLSQALGGFNDALLTYERIMQLEISDPLAFPHTQSFITDVQNAVRDDRHETLLRGPVATNPFHPIRSGVMRLLSLQLVDTFGQVKTVLDINQEPTADRRIVTTELMASPTATAPIWIPPRLAQPARLNMRWLAANPDKKGQDEQEMNDHPATTPICGWLLPNNLDSSLMVYDATGKTLGSIDVQSNWRSAPGDNQVLSASDIDNPYLQKVVFYLITQGPDFFSAFLSALDNALETIDPETFAHHEGLALLMGRPIALVRAAINLELQGPPAVSQNADALWADLAADPNPDGSRPRTTAGFTGVKFPIRIGEYQQLNDGLVGYWLEKANGTLGDTFYAPQSQSVASDRIRTHADGAVNIKQAVDAPRKILTMLVDPRCPVHATSGILPTKAIAIPPDQFKQALQAIEITFLSTPILTGLEDIELPLPKEPGYAWSWLAQENGPWSEVNTIAPVQRQATFSGQQIIREGWLKLRPETSS